MWAVGCRAEVIAHRSRQLEPRANGSAKARAGSGGDRVWGCGDAGDAVKTVCCEKAECGRSVMGIRAPSG